MALMLLDYMAGLGIVGVIASLTGTQYSRLNKKIEKLEDHSISESEVRTIIQDKLSISDLKFQHIAGQLQELKQDNKEINDKLDTLVSVLYDSNAQVKKNKKS